MGMCRNGDLSHGSFGSSTSKGNMEVGSIVDDSVDDDDDDSEVEENGGDTGTAMGITDDALDDDDDDTRSKNSLNGMLYEFSL